MPNFGVLENNDFAAMSSHHMHDHRLLLNSSRAAMESVDSGTNNEWDAITRNKLIEHCVIEGLSDSAIARIYDITPGKVKYKRSKLNISQAYIFFARFQYANPEVVAEIIENTKKRLLGDIDLLSKMITNYAFRVNDHLEELHVSGKGISDRDMKQLNKYMVDRISELLIMAANNDWMKIDLILRDHAIGICEWDECNPKMDELNEYFFSRCTQFMRKEKRE